MAVASAAARLVIGGAARLARRVLGDAVALVAETAGVARGRGLAAADHRGDALNRHLAAVAVFGRGAFGAAARTLFS